MFIEAVNCFQVIASLPHVPFLPVNLVSSPPAISVPAQRGAGRGRAGQEVMYLAGGPRGAAGALTTQV